MWLQGVFGCGVIEIGMACACRQDSAHFKNEQRKQASVDERISRLKENAAKLSKMDLDAHERWVSFLFPGFQRSSSN